MLETLTLLLGVTAAIAWCVAVYSGLSIVRLAPAGGRLHTLFNIGWWRFDAVRSLVGAAAAPHLRRYVSAFVAFFAAMVLIAALAAVALSTRPPVADPDLASRAVTFAPATSSLES